MRTFIKMATWPVIAAPALYLALVWKQIPAEVPLHFNMRGEADQMGGKEDLLTLVTILTALNIMLHLLLNNAHRIDPKRYAASNKERLSRIAFAVVVFLSTLLCFILYNTSRGSMHLHAGLVLAATGLLLAVTGNYMVNLKPNYFAGLRLPWTLENPENWRKTHALGGRLFFAGGLLLAGVCAFLPAPAAFIFFVVVMVIIIFIPVLYSYRLYRQQKKTNR